MQPRFHQTYAPDAAGEREEAARGLLAARPRLSPKWFYDRLGSVLFEAITELPEYYPTRAEAALMAEHAPALLAHAGPVSTLVDLGAGNCEKAARLLAQLPVKRYVAIDVSADFLQEALTAVQRQWPALDVLGLGLDFSATLDLPAQTLEGRPLFFYPGSSIGNFEPDEALRFLRRLRAQADDGALLIGVDMVKPREVLERAYDDALGVTAAFNLNALRHLNTAIGSDFDPAAWRHVARFDAAASRIEMHLEARHALTVTWPGGERRFAAGERILTEHSYKYEPDGFEAMLRDAGYRRIARRVGPAPAFALFSAVS